MCNPQEFFIVLYMTGDCAIGDGVKKYLFSLCLNKVQTGLHLHLGKSMLSFTFLNICGYTDVLIAQFLVYLLRLHWWEFNPVHWKGRPLGRIHLLVIAPGGSVPHGRKNNWTFSHKSGSTFDTGMGQCLFPLLASKDMGAIDAAVLQLEDFPDLDIVEIVSLVSVTIQFMLPLFICPCVI